MPWGIVMPQRYQLEGDNHYQTGVGLIDGYRDILSFSYDYLSLLLHIFPVFLVADFFNRII